MPAEETTDCPQLAAYVASQYALPEPVERCTLIRKGFNYNYLVEAGEEKYVFRIYLNGKYYIESGDDFRFELDWLRFLHGELLPVAYPIPRLDGALLGRIEDTLPAPHYCALFSFAAGTTKKELTTLEATNMGLIVARLHLASTRFTSQRSRYHFNLRYLTEEPLRQIDEFLIEQDRPGVASYLPRIAELEAPIRNLPISPEAYGLIHGDLHRGNVHFNAEGHPTLFDFDHSGFGWRAYDLATYVQRLSEEAAMELMSAYEAIRPLSREERESIPAFQRLRTIWDVGDILAMRAAWGNHKEFGSEFADNLEKQLDTL